MSKLAIIIFCAAVLLSGCSTVPPPRSSGEPPPRVWSVGDAESKPVAPDVQTNFLPVTVSNGVAVIVSNTPPPMIITNPSPVIAPKPAPTPVVAWTSLNRWAAEHHLASPHRISDSPMTTYAIGSTNGVMVLGLGTLGATWNGVEINLGFAPQMIDGEVFLHGLDLQKNLEPLLCEPPLKFPDPHRVIVIDPGHGGANVGTRSVLDGRFEKEFTLDVALRLKPLLETNGWTVFLTRAADVDFPNTNRVTFVTAHHADLFISLHFNSTENRSQKTGGIETYCLTPTGLPSTITRNYPDPWSAVWPNNSFDARNLQLAVEVHSALVRATGLEDRGVCRVRYMTVVREEHCPAVLIENGYLSNPAEAKKIESAEYRQQLAQAIADALK